MAQDDRLYAKFTLDFADSHKIAPLSDVAFRQYMEAILWARRMLTDGLIPGAMARKLFTESALEELTSNDPEHPSVFAVEGGYQLHDFTDHQTSKAQIELMREQKREAGRRGGKASAESKRESSSVQADAKQTASSTPSKIKPETETETSSSTKKKAPASRSTRVPLDFVITAEMREWAAATTPLVDLDAKLPSWIDYWRGVGGSNGLKADWVSTWRNGMRKQQEFAEKDRSNVTPIVAKKKFVAHAD